MSRHIGRLAVAALLTAGCCSPAAAEVVSASANGFSLRQQVHIAATPQQVYAALVQPSRWWSSEHTFSHDAHNMTLDARAGGCFCEKLPNGGSVQHMTVVMVAPGKALTLRGALGPFQSQGADGALSWVLAAAAGQTELTVTYNLGGSLTLPGGFEAWAGKADSMIAEQVARLQKLLTHTETAP